MNLSSAIRVLERALVMELQKRREVVSVGMGVPFLVIIRVLSRYGGGAGVLAGLEGMRAFLDATWAHLCSGKASGGGAGDVAGGAADWRVLRRESLSNSASLVVRVASLCTGRVALWYLVGGGGGAWESLSSYFMRRMRTLMTSWNSLFEECSSPMSLISNSYRVSRALGGGSCGDLRLVK